MSPLAGLRFELVGAPNFRDLGGYRAAGGGRIRSGRIFRSESLARLTDADVANVATLNIELLYDLRNADERVRDPNRWQPRNVLETLADLDSDELGAVHFFGWRDRITDPAFDVARARQWMLNAYGAMPRLFAGCLASALKHLSASSSPVTLLHCTAGKDRTGFVSAMVLFALGVSRDDIVEDYLLTRQRRPPEVLLQTMLRNELQELSPMTHAALLTLADVHEEYLGTALRTIDRDFGSVDAYLAQACNLAPVQRSSLYSQLLV